ncbi:unnamed protein product [Arctia plantaginis]|uniref:Uncharacterized protein n=1 Tax=Arctia plantaginis TaxID=874455 RepID=A0A8S1BS06_ARCPL|nr:unnamed protein product [Arctia plantaginis]
MLCALVLLATVVLCSSHAVLPLVAPAHHGAVVASVPVHGYAGHGYGGYGFGGYGHGYGYGGLDGYGFGHGGHGIGGHGYTGYGLVGHGAHHVLKRSPHIVPVPVAHVAPVAQIAPVAVSHQSRLDVHSSPAVVSASVVQPVVAPVLHAAPLLHKSLVAAPLHFGGLYGAGAGYYGAGHLGYGHY